MGRAGQRLPQQGALVQARRRGRARGRRAGLEAELQQLDLGAEAAAPTGTGLVRDGGHGNGHGDGRAPGGPALQELFQRCVPVQCRPASDEELLLVHSPAFVAKLEPPESPGPALSGPRGAVGAALALLEPVLGGALRNGAALISPQDPQDPPQPAAVAARVAQKQLGVQRVLIVDWSPRPGRSLARIFQEDPSVLYFGAQRGREPPPSAGDGPGEGFSVELQWEQAAVTDGDFAAAAFQLLLPIALQFQPQLVLVEASLEDLGGALGVSPAGFSLLTHLLSALGRGRLLLLLQGGPDLGASPGGVGAVLRTLLGDPGDPLGPIAPTPSGLASIARTLSVQQRYWGCLQSFGEGNPEIPGAPRDPTGTLKSQGGPKIPQGHLKIPKGHPEI